MLNITRSSLLRSSKFSIWSKIIPWQRASWTLVGAHFSTSSKKRLRELVIGWYESIRASPPKNASNAVRLYKRVCRYVLTFVLSAAILQTAMSMQLRIFSKLQGQGMAFRSERTPMGAAFPEKPLRLRMGSCHSGCFLLLRATIYRWLSHSVLLLLDSLPR